MVSATAPSPDPRVGLRPGRVQRLATDTTLWVVGTPAAEAAWNLRLISNTPKAPGFMGVTNSDLAFTGSYAIQGNYNGYMAWDISNPSRPTLVTQYLCPASQSDVSVYGRLLFVSGEGQGGRTDCGTDPIRDSVSPIRLRGIRVFDISDIRNPRYIANVQTCRGSHTHTVVSDPRDNQNVYIYVSGSQGVRSPSELPGCLEAPMQDPNTSLFRIEIIQVPLNNPQNARIVAGARIFEGLTQRPPQATRPPEPGRGGGRGGRGGIDRGSDGPTQCHDITVYPAVGLAGGACVGYGLLLDISDVKNPKRLYAASDSNMAMWHSATFSNDGSRVLFTDEWGGGSGPRCRVTDRPEWGANALFTIENRQMVFKSYYKLPAAQTTQENCVAHNGSLIPIPGREVMVQGWYQGGISIFDWTNASRPFEIAFHDRGPLDADRLVSAGSWSVYWYNGVIVSSEISRGLDIFELVPSPHISQNEIDAARTVLFRELNAQEQQKFVWPPSFAKARAFADQLERSSGLNATRLSAVRSGLSTAEAASGSARGSALTSLASQIDGDVAGSRDAAKVRMLAAAVRELAR